MGTLSRSSTLAQIKRAYVKARAFVTACRLLVLKCPKSTGTPHGQLQTAIDLMQREKAAANWIDAYDTGGRSTAGGPRVRRVSFENCR